MWEFDSPRPHSFWILASESAKAESQTPEPVNPMGALALSAALRGGGYFDPAFGLATKSRSNANIISPAADIGARCARAP